MKRKIQNGALLHQCPHGGVSSLKYLFHHLCPPGESQLPPVSLGHSPRSTSEIWSKQVSNYYFYSWSPSIWDIVYTLKDWSFCFPQSFGAPKISPLAFKVKYSQCSFSQYRVFRVRSTKWGSTLHSLWKTSEILIIILCFMVTNLLLWKIFSVGLQVIHIGSSFVIVVTVISTWEQIKTNYTNLLHM